MLVLSRRRGEHILLMGNSTIEIRVIKIEGNKVSLGIIAPPDVVIARAEVAPSERAEDVLQALLPADNEIAAAWE